MCDDAEDWHDHHTEGFAADMRERVERDLAAFERGCIASHLRDERVRSLVACGGEQENDVLQKAEREFVGIHGSASIAKGLISAEVVS